MIAIYAVHPIMYQTPIFKHLNNFAVSNNTNLIVLFGSDISMKEIFFKETNVTFKPDTPNMLKGFNYVFLKNIGSNQPNGFFSKVNFGFLLSLIKKKYDVVLIHGYDNFTSLMAILICYFFKIKFIWRGENSLTSFANNSYFKYNLKKIIGYFISKANYIAYSCEGNKKFLKYIGVSESKLFFAPSSVDNNFFKQICSTKIIKFRKTSKTLNIVFSGRLTNRKRPFDLLYACQSLANKSYSVKVIFVGDGPLFKSLQTYSILNNLDVVFKGFLNQSKMSSTYTQGDIGVVCSDHDPSPKVVNEMMVCGLPVICSNLVGVAGDLIVHNKTGLIYNCGNISELASLIEDIILNKIDINMLSLNGLSKISMWDCYNTAEAIYKKLNILSNND
jgi:glycosyltransferase involved in cell wall biosynthesis